MTGANEPLTNLRSRALSYISGEVSGLASVGASARASRWAQVMGAAGMAKALGLIDVADEQLIDREAEVATGFPPDSPAFAQYLSGENPSHQSAVSRPKLD